MADMVQKLKPVSHLCENHTIGTHPEDRQPAHCQQPPRYECEVCGKLLCGDHAGGHYHAPEETAKA